MSYARFIEGDIYLFLSSSGGIECCGCSLYEGNDLMGSQTFYTYDDAIQHLKDHEAKGDYVPGYAYEGLERDRKDGVEILPPREDEKERILKRFVEDDSNDL